MQQVVLQILQFTPVYILALQPRQFSVRFIELLLIREHGAITTSLRFIYFNLLMVWLPMMSEWYYITNASIQLKSSCFTPQNHKTAILLPLITFPLVHRQMKRRDF